MGSRSSIRVFAVVAALVGAVAVVGLNQVGLLGAFESEPTIECNTASSVFGDGVTCVGEGSGASALRWPDGSVTETEHSHAAQFVGDGAVELLAADGEVVASAPIRIEPDLAVVCEANDGDPKKIFELEATDLRDRGWDYVYTDATGERVSPGDPAHPNGGSEDGLELIVLDEVQSTKFCRAVSDAVEALDGDYLLAIDSPWEAQQSTPLRLIGPSSSTRWAGTQAAVLTASVTVNNITASERVDVYQSGCS